MNLNKKEKQKQKNSVFYSDKKMVFIKPKPHPLLSPEINYLIMIHNYRLTLQEEV